MLLPDVNVLVYAHREDSPGHFAYREWLESVVNGPAALAIESGSERITTDRGFARFPGLRWRHRLE